MPRTKPTPARKSSRTSTPPRGARKAAPVTYSASCPYCLGLVALTFSPRVLRDLGGLPREVPLLCPQDETELNLSR